MAKVNLKPTPGNVLLEPEEAMKKTASGIVLPETANAEKPQRGKVLAVGASETTDSGAKKEAPCKVGDQVYYKKWGGNELKIENKEYLLVKFDDILAVEE
ncbi:co-chaperone GroES [Candidatus Microgenomates bacterium]|nr:co-chaperone GroES [Candidatus Microgenomates bacterium]